MTEITKIKQIILTLQRLLDMFKHTLCQSNNNIKGCKGIRDDVGIIG